MRTDSAPHTVAGVSRKRTVVCASSGYGKPDQVVERDQAGVVVAMLEAERLGERVEQEGLAGAAATDEQQRVFGDQRRENRRLVAVEAENAEVASLKAALWALRLPAAAADRGVPVAISGAAPVRDARARCERTDGMCRSFVARDRAASAEMAIHLAELGRLAGAHAPFLMHG